MVTKGKVYSDQEAAGIRLLAHAIKRNSERVSRRYRNDGTLAACALIDALAESILDAVNHQRAFAVEFYWQPELFDFEESDDAYGVVE